MFAFCRIRGKHARRLSIGLEKSDFSIAQVVRRCPGSALFHVQSGAKILAEAKYDDRGRSVSGHFALSAIPYLDLGSLEALFNELGAHGTQVNTPPFYRTTFPSGQGSKRVQLAGLLPISLRHFTTRYNRGFSPDIPAAFSSLEEAHNSFQFQYNLCIRLNHEIAQAPTPERLYEPRKFLDVFDQWHRSFRALVHKLRGSMSADDEQAVRILELNHEMFVLELGIVMRREPPRELTWENDRYHFAPISNMLWDAHLEQFWKIVDLAREIVHYVNEGDPERRFGRFASNANIIPSLFGVARLCRDPILRREVVTLLYKAPRHEGLWNSIMTARVCERLIQIEEEGLGLVTSCHDVPDWARIESVRVEFATEGRVGSIVCTRRKRAPTEDGDGELETLSLWDSPRKGNTIGRCVADPLSAS